MHETKSTSRDLTKAVRNRPGVSPLKNPEMQKQFAAGLPTIKNKRIQIVFKSKPALAIQYSIYYNEVNSKFLTPIYVDFIDGKMDLNTALRQADDAINKRLDELKK
jgi:multiple sugar transport system substrate-binding protein